MRSHNINIFCRTLSYSLVYYFIIIAHIKGNVITCKVVPIVQIKFENSTLRVFRFELHLSRTVNVISKINFHKYRSKIVFYLTYFIIENMQFVITLSKVITGLAAPMVPSFFFSILQTIIVFSSTVCTMNALESGLQATREA